MHEWRKPARSWPGRHRAPRTAEWLFDRGRSLGEVGRGRDHPASPHSSLDDIFDQIQELRNLKNRRQTWRFLATSHILTFTDGFSIILNLNEVSNWTKLDKNYVSSPEATFPGHFSAAQQQPEQRIPESVQAQCPPLPGTQPLKSYVRFCSMCLLSIVEVKSPQGCSSCLHEVSSLEFPSQECFLPLAPVIWTMSVWTEYMIQRIRKLI